MKINELSLESVIKMLEQKDLLILPIDVDPPLVYRDVSDQRLVYKYDPGKNTYRLNCSYLRYNK